MTQNDILLITMIFAILNDDSEYNKALMRDAHRLKFCLAQQQRMHSSLVPLFTKPHTIAHSQEHERPLEKTNKEPIYILGHGHIRDKRFYLSNQSAEELFSTLLGSGLNPHQKNLRLVLISCRSGLEIFGRSFAEELLEYFYHRLHEIEWRHREIEGTNPIIQAPKTLISFSGSEMWTIGNEYYEEYKKIDSDISDWVEKHAKPARRKDFQFFPGLIRYESKVECLDEKPTSRTLCAESSLKTV